MGYSGEEARLAQLVALSVQLGYMDDAKHWTEELKKFRAAK